MAENSKIEWTSHTFNPWRGCTKVSEGCANCYADTLSKRNPGTLGVWGPNGTRVVASEAMWREPVKWDKAAAKAGERPRVFCASLADVFEDWGGPMVDAAGEELSWDGINPVTITDVRARLFCLIDATPNLDWLVLTKRPENIERMMPDRIRPADRNMPFSRVIGGFRPNVWLGTSIENQATADERIPHLLRVPAKVRFLSVEPMLGAIDLPPGWAGTWGSRCPKNCGNQFFDAAFEPQNVRCNKCNAMSVTWKNRDTGIHWVIVGGESGPGARPCQVEWIRDIVRQCKAARVPCFVKQLGAFIVDRNDAWFEAENETWVDGPDAGKPTMPEAWPTPVDVIHDLDGTRDGYQGAPVRVKLIDRKGGDINEWPTDLRAREFPVAQHEEATR